MAIRKPQSVSSSRSSRNDTAKVKGRLGARKRMRQMLHEQLENRQLLAVGPQLIGIQPNNSDLITDGAVRHESPRELTFRFDDSQVIHPQSLDGIRITRSGGDGSFGLASVASDFGSIGEVDIQLTSSVPGQTPTVQVTRANLGANVPPAISSSGSTLSITLNSNSTTPTTAQQLVDSINGSNAALGVVRAKINGGLPSTKLGQINPATYSPIRVSGSGDVVLTPGQVLIGAAPNDNEVTFRFADTLPNDKYRVEVFGFDDPLQGITGLRGSGANGNPGDLFQPTVLGTRQDTIDFFLDLGPQVTSVVPQPVVRDSGGALQQRRDTIVVYFDGDKLLVENDAAGNPTTQSAENPEFYQLIFTNDTVRNTDDLRFLPQSVEYNASANTATLRFGQDIDSLPGSNAGPSTFRLRIGTRETAPIAPTFSEAAATAITDFNTNGAVKFRFVSRVLGEAGSGIQIVVTNSNTTNPGDPPLITATGRTIQIDLGRDDVTAAELLAALQTSSSANALVSVVIEPGSNPSTVLNAPINYSPINVVGLGSSFNTASDLGVIGSSAVDQTSIILSSEIEPVAFEADLPGASDDPGHRVLPDNVGGGYEQHINDLFGADSIDGITTIMYNFKTVYGVDSTGTSLINAITEKQKDRAREVFQTWSNHIGVQFIETADQGITVATGTFAALGSGSNVVTANSINLGVRIDPTFSDSLLVLESARQWGDNYGEDYFRSALTGLGFLLGLERAGDLPSGTLMALSTAFVNAGVSNGVPADEPVFPGTFDVLHGQHVFRNDSNDIDLYRFEVALGDQDRVGLFVAETIAERLGESSSLDSLLHLYKQVQATALSNMATGADLGIRFDAVKPGLLGNNLQVFVTKSDRGPGAPVLVNTFDNLITVDLNSHAGEETTAQQFIDAVNADAAASALVHLTLESGDGATVVGNRQITYSPIVLQGGDIELISRNDDYFSEDSMIRASLSSGIYYLGVSASGNDDYNAVIEDTGFGGGSQGRYDLRLTFRAQVDTSDAIRDVEGGFAGDVAVTLDGDADGTPGGTYDFWFQTRPLDRTVEFTAGAFAGLEGKIITLTGANGVVRRFEFDSDGTVGIGNVKVSYTLADTAGRLAELLATAIRSRVDLGVGAIANGTRLVLQGERSIQVGAGLDNVSVHGRTIFVDKSAGPAADGSLAKPFNNISGVGVPNAFSVAQPGDIVRIVGNGGADGDVRTLGDNFAYEIGFNLISGAPLSDGGQMEVPKGVTTMIDAGAIFKMRRSRIGVGSSSLGVDRSGGALQVLGTPTLTDNNGNRLRATDGSAIPGSVYFTSWLDESLGADTYAPLTTPAVGDWGGISYRNDVDSAAGRRNLEDEGIFLQYVNHADIRFGGGGNVVIDSVQQVVNPVQMIDVRPTVTFNSISNSADAAMSAAPNSFAETNFNEPKYQANGAFTSDYDRVGPEIHHNMLVNNSLNGLFIKVETPAGQAVRPLTVSARFDDVDIPHIVSENIIISGSPGGALLDNTRPLANLVALQPSAGGTLLPGTVNYKISYVDQSGYETLASDATASIVLGPNQTAVQLLGLPRATGDYVARKIYRSDSTGGGQYMLVAQIDALSTSFTDTGANAGGVLVRDRADVSNVSLVSNAGGGTLNGVYNYRLVMVDSSNRESVASDPTANVDATAAADSTVTLTNLPPVQAGFASRRLYRSAAGGSGPYVLVAELGTSNSYVDTGSILTDAAGSPIELPVTALGTLRPRLDASLVIDPGTVLKFEGARIEIEQGAMLLAEGTDGAPIIMTSKLDDRYGAGGAFDTNNDGVGTQPQPRDWGGIYAAAGSTLSLDHTTVAYAGGVTKIEGTFKAFNPVEIQQANARITNSTFEFNEDGIGGQGPRNRLGRLDNRAATIFVRGAQPILIGNTFLSNQGSPINIDANSLNADLIRDMGRSTGNVDRNSEYDSNRGPLVRENRLQDNQMNGMEVRHDLLMVESVWDDTDIVHILFGTITVSNMHHEGGLRLQSAPDESLVIKIQGYGSNFDEYLGAGFTATGFHSSIADRVGGTIEVLGQPGFPVVLTSFHDDTVGAGLRPDGTPQTDTNNNGIGSIPRPADWRGLLFDQYSNDRNVATVLELENPNAIAPGINSTSSTAQLLGDLAGDASSSDENLRLGFAVQGVLSEPTDVDVYSFTAEAGTEIWIDVDHTTQSLDMMIELLNANGELLARSDNSNQETIDPSLLVRTPAVQASLVNPLNQTVGSFRTNASGTFKEDGSINPRDAGMRVLLPGARGTRTTFHFRVRSASTNPEDFNAGLTSGSYEVQVRTRAAQEFPGSTVQYADIRYATNGIQLKGLPGHSPLLGEFQEDEASVDGNITNNDVNVVSTALAVKSQYVGNLLRSDRATISIGGELSGGADLDFYQFDLSYNNLLNNSATAGLVADAEPNDSVAGAQNLDNEIWSRTNNANVANSTTRPYVTIAGTGDGTFDYYSFNVPFAGATGTFDIDGASFDTELFLYDSSGNLLTLNDDSGGDAGSVSALDSFITFTFPNPGTYVIAVAQFPSDDTGGGVGGTPIGPGETYQLHVSVDGKAVSTAVITAPVVFDLDYADGLNRADTSLSIFRVGAGFGGNSYQLVYYAEDSNIADDRGDITDLSKGSVGAKDPYIGSVNLPLGTYAVAVSSASRVPAGLAGARRAPVYAALQQANVGTFSATNSEVVSSEFDLSGYSALDLPRLYFDRVGGGAVDILVRDASGNEVVVSNGFVPTGAQSIIDLGPQMAAITSQLTDLTKVKIVFRGGAIGSSIQAMAVGFAERGEQIINAPQTSAFSNRTVPANTILSGTYQLEIRQGDTGRLNSSNSRAAEQLTLVAPAGSALVDGDTFTLRDAGNELVFEFSVDALVTPGNIPVRYSATDPANVVAQSIRDAINDPGVQSRIAVSAASRSGSTSGPTADAQIDLFGRASGEFGKVGLIVHNGQADQNTNRDQGQVLIRDNFIRYSRDYGVWTGPGERLQDPRDTLANIAPTMGSAMSNIPALAGVSTGAVRNLAEPNNNLIGGFSPGIVVTNNVLESGGLGGVHIAGENPIWMITPQFVPPIRNADPATGDASTGSNTNPFDHFGSFIDDSDLLYIDSGRTRVKFEFEDIAGGGTGSPVFGSGVAGGNGWDDDAVPMYYREDGGAVYLRIAPSAPGYSALEVVQAMRDSIFGSILVTNGTTQNVKATVAPSLLGPDPVAPMTSSTGYINYYNRPALYLEGVSDLNFVNRRGGGNPFDIRRVDVAQDSQPFVRAVNNTVYGNDGRASFAGETTAPEPNNTIREAVETWQGTGHNPLSYNADATIGFQDVDLYKFKLDIGERVLIDIDTDPATSSLDSVLQIFDSSGRPQYFSTSSSVTTTLSDNTAAPGEAQSLDPYADFTAVVPGVYYAAVSSRGNSTYDPLSLGGREAGVSGGDYNIDLMVLHPQEFTITAEDASQYASGDTFTIFQVADLGGGSNSRTFEFTTGGAVAPGNIPINFNANYRAPDMARAIAGAINGPNNVRPLPNRQQLDNGTFGLANPLAPVSAVALGGISGVQAGLTLFPRRNDGVPPYHSSLGIGHDRTASGQLSNTSIGDGTTERFVVVSNAAYIQGNGSIIVDPDVTDNNNLDQLLPETGILVTAGASPTLMNNVFVNVQTPIVNEETRSTGTRRFNRNPQPFGSTAANQHSKPGEVIVGGSVYQFAEPAVASNRFGFGIETGPTNVPNTGLDFNITLPGTSQVFVDAQSSQFLPARGSRIIDSSLDSLEEREAFRTIKQAMGIAVSPVLAPTRDAVGQLRVDDPTVAPPNGQGADVFKDRGALDRADFVGPTAEAVGPLDNDAGNIDKDSAVSVIQLSGGVYPEFRVQLVDGIGTGIYDPSVLGPASGLRQPGAAVTLFENGVMLTEGIDYRFSFDSTTNELIFTPLAGVWKNDRVYEIAINNKDRFVLFAPAGDQVSDADGFTITDADGGVVYFEFDSGYRLQVPQGLTLTIPLAGGATGGIADGDRFTITIAGVSTTFEFDRNGNFLAGNRPIPFQLGANQAQMRDVVFNAIQSSGLAVIPRMLGTDRIFLGSERGVRVDTTFTAIDQPATTMALKMPVLGPRPGGVVDGQTIKIGDGRRTVTFEYDSDGVVASGNLAIDFAGTATAADLADVTLQALAASPLNINPSLVATDTVHIGLSPNGSVDVGGSAVSAVGVARTLTDGEKFTISGALGSQTFEFTRDATVAAGNIGIPVALQDTQDEIGERIASAIQAAGLGLTPAHIADGNISVGGTVNDSIDVSMAPALSLFGEPGVQSNTRLQVFGPLLLQVPARGASEIVENSTFSVSSNGSTVVFEMDSDFSGPSQPGNLIIRYNSLSTATDIANSVALAINGAGIGVNATVGVGGQVNLGQIQLNQVDVGTSGFTTTRGVVSDGEIFIISDGVNSVTFEFENVDVGNGFNLGSSPILFSGTSTPDSVVASMKAVIEGSPLGLAATILPGGVLELNATPRYSINSSLAPTLLQSGVPGGANPVRFIQDSSFSGVDMKQAMIDAINRASGTNLLAKDRGGATLFVEGAVSISTNMDSFFLQGVSDLAGNFLQPNRINNETAFTILMPGVTLDYGDAPDPVSTTLGRYPTSHFSDGARHVVSNTAILGSTIDAEVDGQPTPNADGDTDDGVTFGTNYQIERMFNRNIQTPVTVTISSPGFVDGWIDFNSDGDWDDPGEQILQSVEFGRDQLTQTFLVTVPATAPVPASVISTFARFRSSTTGSLTPTGLATDGEVEDYEVKIAPGTPPRAVDDQYVVNEDGTLVTSDATGTSSPGFTIDDGVAANDVDVEGGPLGVTEVSGPTHAKSFQLFSDGTFAYQPNDNFYGMDTFVYRVNDGILNSNNLGTVTITVREINDLPTAAGDSFTTDEDQVLVIDQAQLLGNDSAGPNEASQVLTVTGVQAISTNAGGSVSLSGGQITYTPPSNYSGTDFFTYTVTDNGTTGGVAAPLSATATVTVTILDKNDPPIVTPLSLQTPEDTSLPVAISTLEAQAVAGPGAEQTTQQVQFHSVIPTSTNGGTVVVSGNSVIYTPPADFAGVDTFFYEVEDNGFSNGLPDPQRAVGTVTVTVDNINDAPNVRNPFGQVTMQEDEPARVIDLASVFRDPDVLTSNDQLTYRIVSNSNSGLVTPQVNGAQLTLQLLADQNGTATIVVEARDIAGLTVQDTLTLVVNPVNDGPRLVQSLPDVTVAEDAPIGNINLSPAYFFDPDVILNGDQLTFAVVSNSNPLLVTPSLNGSVLSMVLTANQSGNSVITISATDSSGQTVTDSFTVQVNPVNDVPITTPDSYTVPQGGDLITTDPRGTVGGAEDDGVLANDVDPEGATISAILVSSPVHASVFGLNTNGTFTYRHNGLTRDTDSFTYRATDGSGQSTITTVTITIGDPPPPLHQNPSQNLDVNADGFISPIDALLIVNFINTNGSGQSVAGLPAPPPYRDVDGNNTITANDVLQVINYLNAHSGQGEGEGFDQSIVVNPYNPQLTVSVEDVMRSSGSGRVGVREVERDGETYGPLLPTESIFGELGAIESQDSTAWADVSWVTDSEEVEDEPIDLALSDLLSDWNEGL